MGGDPKYPLSQQITDLRGGKRGQHTVVIDGDGNEVTPSKPAIFVNDIGDLPDPTTVDQDQMYIVKRNGPIIKMSDGTATWITW